MRSAMPLLFAIALLLGCSSAADPNLPKLYPVSGHVTLDGEPLVRASLVFTPQGSTPGSGCSAITDATGKYDLATLNQGPGAPLGEYKVFISKIVQPDGMEFPVGTELDPMSTAHKELVPKRYSDPELATLTATITEAGEPLDFPLKSK